VALAVSKISHDFPVHVLATSAFQRAMMGADHRVVVVIFHQYVVRAGPTQDILAQEAGYLLRSKIPVHHPLIEIERVNTYFDSIDNRLKHF
jgi:hypothetical protein